MPLYFPKAFSQTIDLAINHNSTAAVVTSTVNVWQVEQAPHSANWPSTWLIAPDPYPQARPLCSTPSPLDLSGQLFPVSTSAIFARIAILSARCRIRRRPRSPLVPIAIARFQGVGTVELQGLPTTASLPTRFPHRQILRVDFSVTNRNEVRSAGMVAWMTGNSFSARNGVPNIELYWRSAGRL